MLGHNKAKTQVMAIIMLFLLLLAALPAVFAYPDIKVQETGEYLNWTYENFPVFKTDGIKLRYIDVTISNWKGLFIKPKLILISKQSGLYEIGSPYHHAL